MTAPSAPLDEIVGRREEVIAWWLGGDGLLAPPFQHMEERFIHRYFSEQPFFDWTTKNGSLFLQSQHDIPTYQTVHNRQALEAALRRHPGQEYVIAGEPQLVQPGPGVEPGQKTNVWVLRKQDRLQDPPEGVVPTRENPYPATETRGTYYIVNENVFQAPSVADLVGNRMLSVINNLNAVFEKAAALPTFTPTTGHTYLLPASSRPTTAMSRQGSPSRSREGSIAPGMDSQSLRSGSLAPDGSQGGGGAASASDEFLNTRLLVDSLRQTATYGDEYMDENPLLGEPGAFKFTSSTAAVKKRKADEEAAALAAQKARELKEAGKAPSRAASPAAPVKAPTPPPVFTEKAVSARTDRDKKEERKRRRKSKPNAGTATSPTTPKSGGSGLGQSSSAG